MGIKCRLIDPIGVRHEVSFYHETKPMISIPITKEEYENEGKWEIFRQKYPQYSDYSISFSADHKWNTEDGTNKHPGDMYWADWCHFGENNDKCNYWDDCHDPRGHLIVVLPNGTAFDTMSIASNCCSAKQKTGHRCWTMTGEAPNITLTPSILNGNWHGYLRNGELVQ